MYNDNPRQCNAKQGSFGAGPKESFAGKGYNATAVVVQNVGFGGLKLRAI